MENVSDTRSYGEVLKIDHIIIVNAETGNRNILCGIIIFHT
jgi:hypothetical protein